MNFWKYTAIAMAIPVLVSCGSNGLSSPSANRPAVKTVPPQLKVIDDQIRLEGGARVFLLPNGSLFLDAVPKDAGATSIGYKSPTGGTTVERIQLPSQAAVTKTARAVVASASADGYKFAVSDGGRFAGTKSAGSATKALIGWSGPGNALTLLLRTSDSSAPVDPRELLGRFAAAR